MQLGADSCSDFFDIAIIEVGILLESSMALLYRACLTEPVQHFIVVLPGLIRRDLCRRLKASFGRRIFH